MRNGLILGCNLIKTSYRTLTIIKVREHSWIVKSCCRYSCESVLLHRISTVFHKGEEAGIIVVENEESYTSKCDALALESFDDCKRRTTNRRLVRGLYRSSIGHLVNADVNGALNIMRKHVLKAHPSLNTQIKDHIQSQHSVLLNPFKCSMKYLKSNYETDGLSYNLGFTSSALAAWLVFDYLNTKGSWLIPS